MSTFFIVNSADTELLNHTYSTSLVILSFVVATCGSGFAIFVVNAKSSIQSERTRQMLLLAGAVAFGLSVWSMHFIGMLALSLCTTVKYDTGITLLSGIPAIFAARLVLQFVAVKNSTPRRLLMGGVVTGAGIGTMHYAGMLAMQMNASLRFDPQDFALSIVAAVVLATVALGARVGLSRRLRIRPLPANLLSAIVMGLAITAMHYGGMAAARFIGEPETIAPIPATDGVYLSTMIAVGLISMLGLVAFLTLFSKLKDSMAILKLQGYELEAIVDYATEAIVTTHANGTIKSVNRTFENIFGYPQGTANHHHISAFLPHWSDLKDQHNQQFAYETIGLRRDGTEFPVRLSLTRLKTDLLAFYLGFISDLSDAKRIHEKLVNEANQDFLTKLFNRRYFEEQLSLEMERCQRAMSPLSLIILDIDHFKQINDSFGHLFGDRVLALLANALKEHSRNSDVLARFGGEEFVVLLPDTDMPTAKLAAERLRTAAEKLKIISLGKRVRFTISVGVSSSVTSDRQFVHAAELLKEADTALYQAKNGGRNRVETFDAHRVQSA